MSSASLTMRPIASSHTQTRATELSGRRDVALTVAIAMLCALGLVMVYSASSVFAAKTQGNAQHFLVSQALSMAVGAFGFWFAGNRTADFWNQHASKIFVVAFLLCVVVLVPGIGRVAGGARRWLSLGVVGFQPSEVAKLAVVIWLAFVLARRDKKTAGERPSLLLPVLLVQLPVVCILAEPDLGTALVIEMIVGIMVFSAGLSTRTMLALALAGLPVVYHLVVGTPFRLQRVLSYIDPWAYRSTVGYQVTESLISIGSGGLFGTGLGRSTHKLFFLPEAHTDFIFAIFAEELGFVGVVLLLGLFGFVIVRGVQIALRARTPFEGYLAIGLVAMVGVPAAFNVCVVTGLLPTKGLPLPFISYGRTNLMVLMVAMGILSSLGTSKSAPRPVNQGGRP